MKIIWTFTLMMIPGVVSSISVTGYSGGGVMIKCKNEEKNKTDAKHFCKGEQWPGCSDLIKTNKTNKWVDSGRFSLYDNTSSAVLKVTIRDLKEEDSGTYYCGVNKTEVKLKVLTGQQSKSLRVYSGGNVNISFRYEKKDTTNVKICKYGKTDRCVTVINTNRPAEWKQDGRFSVHDDRSPGLLLLFIRDLNKNDSGKYRITVKVSEDYSLFSEFDLDIGDEVLETPSPSSSTSPRSSSSPSPPPSSSSSSSASSFSSVKTSRFTGVSRTSSILSAFPKTSAGSSLIVPLVLTPLVLIFPGLLLLFLCKKRHSKGGDLNSQIGPGKHEVVSHTGCAHIELPKYPSDSSDTVYATAQLPTNPSDSSDTVYATAQLPTNPSDSSNCVYATVEKATGDSQCCITSAEDLNYAVVNFHKKSDCPDSVSIRNNQDYSEYAAVNHLTA